MTTENTPVTPNPEAPDAAAVAAAAAAAAKPTPEAKPEPIAPLEADDAGKGGFTYQPTGDSKLDMTLAFVGKHGFGPEHPAIKAAIEGDFSLMKAQMAEKGIAGADAYIALGEAAYATMKAENDKRRAEDKAAVEAVVGGAENWEAIKEWAGKNADDSEKTAISALLSKGGMEAKIAATFLAANFSKANGGTELPAKETDGAGPSAAVTAGRSAASTDALSPKEYGQAVVDARRTHSNRAGPFEQSPAYVKLVERRSRWRE